MVLSKNQSQHIRKPSQQQQHKNKYRPQFQGYRGQIVIQKQFHQPNKISLSLPQCFNLIRVHPLAKGLFPTNPIPEVPLSGRLQLFCLILAKLTQDPSILNIYGSRI